jgi:osmoprotectant transport system substrate-binding protein
VLGTKNFTEQFVLGQLYAQALRARGFRVTLKPNIGSSEIVDKTLVSGTIDLYPEYTGVVVGVLAGSRADLRSARQTYELAKAFEASRGIAMLRPSPFSDALAIAVTPATARRHRLRAVGDLRRLGPFTFGGAPENRTRYQGLVGMRSAYGLTNARYLTIPLGPQYAALDSGRAQAVNVLTTDGQLREGRYVVLADPKGIFGFQNVAPVVRRGVLAREGPAFARTLNAVTKLLTPRAMQSMNGAVDIDHRPPAAVARAFLRSHGLL